MSARLRARENRIHMRSWIPLSDAVVRCRPSYSDNVRSTSYNESAMV